MSRPLVNFYKSIVLKFSRVFSDFSPHFRSKLTRTPHSLYSNKASMSKITAGKVTAGFRRVLSCHCRKSNSNRWAKFKTDLGPQRKRQFQRSKQCLKISLLFLHAVEPQCDVYLNSNKSFKFVEKSDLKRKVMPFLRKIMFTRVKKSAVRTRICGVQFTNLLKVQCHGGIWITWTYVNVNMFVYLVPSH